MVSCFHCHFSTMCKTYTASHWTKTTFITLTHRRGWGRQVPSWPCSACLCGRRTGWGRTPIPRPPRRPRSRGYCARSGGGAPSPRSRSGHVSAAAAGDCCCHRQVSEPAVLTAHVRRGRKYEKNTCKTSRWEKTHV